MRPFPVEACRSLSRGATTLTNELSPAPTADLACHWEDTDSVIQDMYSNVSGGHLVLCRGAPSDRDISTDTLVFFPFSLLPGGIVHCLVCPLLTMQDTLICTVLCFAIRT